MSNKDRLKASDVYREMEPMFGKKVPFSEAFPMIETLDVVVRRRGTYGVEAWNREQRYGIKDMAEYIDCTNPLCYNGGFSMGKILRGMVAEGQTHFENGHIPCQGYEGSPKGKRRYRSCTNSFDVIIDLSYKQ